MKKRDIVKSNILFNDIINKGIQARNKYYIISKLESTELKNKYGIAVGKKFGNAVTRNKVKRQIRSIITNNSHLFPKFYNYIIICKKEVLNLKYKDMEIELLKLLNKGDANEK